MNITIISILAILLARLRGVQGIYMDSVRYIYFDHSHHLYYGFALVLLTFLLKKFVPLKLRYLMFGIGAGLVVDDIFVLKYIFTGYPLDPIAEYWSPLFILPLLAGILLIAVFEDKLKRII